MRGWVIALWSTCCASTPARTSHTRPLDLPFYVVSDGPTIASVADAVEFWQRQSGRQDLITWERAELGRGTPIHVYYDIPFQWRPDRVTLGVAHPAVRDGIMYACSIQILPLAQPQAALEQKVLRHELGHCLLLDHEESGGIMHPIISRGGQYVARFQRRFLRRLRGVR